ncbi:copper resistance protein B [Dyella sp. A6]|uniref:copper resistance protein B n=1 Tax=Dyella aluminiiresistens TaxID=3069105 RepID=UPI002E7764B3|nr:copper resistance protein B [Dyella sp. A6]
MSAHRRTLLLSAMLLPGLAMASAAQQTTAPATMDMPGMPMRPMKHAMPAKPMVTPKTKAPQRKLPPNDHVPPAPPQHPMPALSSASVAGVMHMRDHPVLGMLLVQRLERDFAQHGGASTAWSMEGWWGGDIDRLWLDSEGEHASDGTRDARVEAFWGHAVASFWDTRLGVRHDFGQGPSRNWIAAGVEGLAPYWFELNATVYAGPQGRTAARTEVNYELFFTQRLILQPSLEMNLYGKSDQQRDIHAGLATAELGLRLRYEFSRRFAPYVGVSWAYRHPVDNVLLPPWRQPEPVHALTWLAGVRFWF